MSDSLYNKNDPEHKPRTGRDGYDPDISQAEIDWLTSLDEDETDERLNGRTNSGVVVAPGNDSGSTDGKSE